MPSSHTNIDGVSRRTLLSIAGGLGVSPWWTESGRIIGGPSSIGSELLDSVAQDDDLFIDKFPAYPDDPFIITHGGYQLLGPTGQNGWSPAPRDEELRTLLGFHPDVLGFKALVGYQNGNLLTFPFTSAELDFSLQTRMPSSSGFNPTFTQDEKRAKSWFGSLMDSWKYPDGRKLENPTEIFAEMFNGQTQEITWGDGRTPGIPSPFAGGTLDLIVQTTVERFKQGYSGFFVDGVNIFNLRGLDFSIWARSAFQNYLDSLSESRLNELGIDDPASFNIREYLRNQNLEPSSNNDPREDPVFREYLLHQHLGLKDFFRSYREIIHDEFPDRAANGDIKLYGNNFMGLTNPQQANFYATEYFDFMDSELTPTVKPAIDHVYKIQLALTRFEKPAIAHGELAQKPAREGFDFDPERNYPMLNRFQVAEAYAMGSKYKIQLTSVWGIDATINHWLRSDGTVDEKLQTFIDFIWAHKRFLHDTGPNNPIAVVWSLPDRVWRRIPQWDIGGFDGDPGIESFAGTTTILQETQIPYDVLAFGHPDLWDDADQRSRLTQYDAVVLPSIQSITDTQLKDLETYLEEGGKIIVSGKLPERSEMFESRDDVSTALEHENVFILEDDPGAQRYRDGHSDGTLVKTLQSNNINSLIEEMDASIAVNKMTENDETRQVLHVLNYDYDRDSDSFTPKKDLRIQLPKPDFKTGIARFYSPQETTDLEIEDRGDSVEFEIPKLVEWGFVVVAPSQEALQPSTPEQTANDGIKRAREVLTRKRDAGQDWSQEYVTAEVKLQSAETAKSYNAFGQAKTAADEAVEWAKDSYPQPVIAIDQAHGQSQQERLEAPFDWLHETFPRYEISTLTDWSGEPLNHVDVLIVPPAFSFMDEEYDFKDVELDQIESFVTSGGSLAIMARGGVASDIDALTERFDFRFDGRPIVFPDRDYDTLWYNIPVAWTLHHRHELTHGIPAIDPNLATSVESRPEEMTILAEVPSDSPSWFHEVQPLREQNSGEDSAAGSPIYGVSKVGEGHVVSLGTHRHLINAQGSPYVEAAMRNLLSVLGREANKPEPKTEETPTSAASPSPTATSTATPTQSTIPSPSPKLSLTQTKSPTRTSTETPGFTSMIGLVGLLTGIFVRLLRNSGDGDK